MKHTIGPILLIAGTAIGSGVIALPMVLAPLGLWLTVLLMIVIWLLVYYTALVSLELNLQAQRGLPLDQLAHVFSGPMAQSISVMALFSLSYALLAVYIDGSSAMIQSWLSSVPSIQGWNTLHLKQKLSMIAFSVTILLALILVLPIRRVDQTNRLLFLGLIIITGLLLLGLSQAVDWHHMPWRYPTRGGQHSTLRHHLPILSVLSVLSVLLTSFGFQVIFHTLTHYCQSDATRLKKAFFWGSIIPAGLYLVWTVIVLSVLYDKNPAFYSNLTEQTVSVGELIKHLSQITAWPGLQKIIWSISLLAILTSMVGVGLGLYQTLVPRLKHNRVTALLGTVLPPFLLAVITPGAFIAILRVAGLILTVIAILMPVYLLYQLNPKQFYYPVCAKHRYRISACLLGGLIVLTELSGLYYSFSSH